MRLLSLIAALLLGGALLWEITLRAQMGMTFSFMEEIWSRNLGHLSVTPLRPWELFVGKIVGPALIAFAIVMPLVHGVIGTVVGTATGLSVGGATILGVLAASASYIAAPAAVRLALPEANPGVYLAASLGMTFPFNLVVGIPLYLAIAETVIG